VKASMMLADFAQAVEGKLYLMGGGWTEIGPDPSPFAIVVQLSIPLHEIGTTHTWELNLLDEDMNPAKLSNLPDAVPIHGEFSAGRRTDYPPGIPILLNLCVNSGPLPFLPNRRYAWQLRIDGGTEDDWVVWFHVRPTQSA
jgi:hypothetical protein